MRIEFVDIKDLTKDQMDFFYKIYSDSYLMDRSEFDSKTQSLDQYALYRSKEGRIIGYTGIRKRKILIDHTYYNTIYFGQAFILKEFRRSGINMRMGAYLCLKTKIFDPFTKIIFWMDALSYKPYLIYTSGFKHFYPSPDIEPSDEYIKIRDELGKVYYPESYDPKSGIVQKVYKILKNDELQISKKDLQNKYIQYYLKCNPEYYKGNGIIILCSGTLFNVLYFICQKGMIIVKRKIISILAFFAQKRKDENHQKNT